MGYSAETKPAIDIYGSDGTPESIVMFDEGLEDVPEIAARNMRMGPVSEARVVFETPSTKTPNLTAEE